MDEDIFMVYVQHFATKGLSGEDEGSLLELGNNSTIDPSMSIHLKVSCGTVHDNFGIKNDFPN